VPGRDLTGSETLDPDYEAPRPPVGLNPLHLLWVLCGGAIGTFARQGAESLYPSTSQGFGETVLVINALGCLFIGVLIGAFFRSPTTRVGLRLFLVTGILGGWTTYGGVTVIFLTLSHDGKIWNGLAVWIMTLVSNIGFAALGLFVGRRLSRTEEAS
jgi:fluoride exporter